MTLSYGKDTVYFNITNVIPIIIRPTFTIVLLTSTSYSIQSSTISISESMPDLINYNITQTSY